MKKILFGVLFLLCLSFSLNAQLNEYKYVIVPINFNGFKKDNQYKTSTLIKHLFSQKGFETYYENNIPFEVNAERCKALTVDLLHTSTMFNTSATLVLKDCNSREVYSTLEGTSKQKNVEKSYKEAIEATFVSIQAMAYAYTPSKKEEPIVTKNVVSSETVPKEVADNEKLEAPAPPATTAAAITTTAAVVDTKETTAADKVQNTPEVAVTSTTADADIWYAQEIPNGFQLVDKTPSVQLKIYKTETANMYIAEGQDSNGVVYKREGEWFFEYYESGKKTIKKLNLKF